MLQVLDKSGAFDESWDFMGEQGKESEVALFDRVILSVGLAEREVVEALLVGARILEGVQGSPPQVGVRDLRERLLKHT